MSFKRTIASVSLAVGLAAPVAAQDVTLRMATAAPVDTIWQQQFDQMAADVFEETEGRVQIEIFYSSQLGSEQAVLPQVMRGRIDMGAFSTAGVADQLGDAYLVNLPFYYQDITERACILETVTADYRELLSPMGVRLIDWSEVGSAQLVGKQPYPTPDTVEGARMGAAANPVSNMFWEGLSAFPVMAGTTEAASGMSTGLIDTYLTTPVFYLFAGIAQVAPVLTKLDYLIAPGVILISDRSWNKLSDEDKAALERAIERRPFAERSATFFGFESQVLQLAASKGVQIVEPSAEERAQWLENQEEFYTAVLENSSDEGRKFFEQLQAARESCQP